MLHYALHPGADDDGVVRFLLTAAAVASSGKTASISGAGSVARAGRRGLSMAARHAGRWQRAAIESTA